MGLHVDHLGALADAPLDALGHQVGFAQVEVGGELEVQGDARAALLLEDGDVVGLLDEGLGQGDGEHAVAQVKAADARLDVHDDVAAGQRPLDCCLDEVGGAVALDHGLSGWHADDHVGEVAPG